jgi:hypothetical protein
MTCLLPAGVVLDGPSIVERYVARYFAGYELGWAGASPGFVAVRCGDPGRSRSTIRTRDAVAGVTWRSRERTLEVVIPSTGRGQQLLAMRATRALITRALALRGAKAFHAAAFVLGSGAWVLVGGKHQGKTTTLLAAMRAGGRLLANDTVYVEDGDAIGLPVALGVRASSLRLFPELVDLDGVGPRLHWENGDTNADELLIPPATIAARLDTTVCARSRIAGIVEMQLCPGGSDTSLTPLTDEDEREAVVARHALRDPLHHDTALRDELAIPRNGVAASIGPRILRLSHPGIDPNGPLAALRSHGAA